MTPRNVPFAVDQPFDDSPAASEVERYELRERPRYRFEANRREFVQTLGAGLVIAIASARARAQQRGGRRESDDESSAGISERFHIGQDGIVTVLTSKVEVGQGSRTQIAQAAAEELRLPVEQIRLIMGDTELCPDDGGTAGSRTTPSTVPRVRYAAAAAREALAEFAAEELGVKRSLVEIRSGKFVDTSSGSELSLADLARSGTLLTHLQRTSGSERPLREVEQWTILGTSVPNVNGRDVVTGTVRYPADITLPGMLRGKVVRPPAFNAKLTAIDLTTAKGMDGVTVVRDGDFIGCAARTTSLARHAAEAVAKTAQWEIGEYVSSDELYAHLKASSGASGGGWPRPSANRWGGGEAAINDSNKKLADEYTIAYIQHAPMEPRAAVAHWEDGKLTVWTGTQQPSRVHGELVDTFRVAREQVRVIATDAGGGFGGKHSGEAAVEAARLAQAVGRPVSICWTREEEFNWAYCRPAGVIEVRAGLDDRGRLHAWDFANYNSGGSAIDTPYAVPHGRTQFLACDSPLRQGSYRALASTANTFARESAMDNLAALAKLDPLEFRLQHLPEGRLRDVLIAAADRFQWRKRRSSQTSRRGIGLACGTEKGSYVAACAEVEIQRDRILVHSICQAYECGAIQNPANLRSQVEGCIVMGLGGALMEEVRFAKGRVSNASFSGYRVPRMSDLPQMDLALLDRQDLPSVGAGETPIIAVAPAVSNAVFHATGKRLRALPLRLTT